MEDTIVENENTALLEELMRDVEKVPEPGELTGNSIITKGEDEVPPMVGKVSSAGYVKMYDTRTGDVSLTNYNMLPMQLRKRREDGSLVFTTRDPGFRPNRGTYKCLLHKDNPNREKYDSMGLALCQKSNLTNQFQVMRHMQKRHKMEWEAIELDRKQTEKLEQQNLFRGLLDRDQVSQVIHEEEIPPIYESPNLKPPKVKRGRKNGKK